LRSVNDMSSKL